MFKKVATLQFKKIYASDSNGNYYWRDFVKQANDKLATDSNFVPKNFYEYNTDKFLYLTARAISGMEKWGPNGNFDAFPWEELKKSYPTFCCKGYYIEHKEDDEKDAKGIILDAQPDDVNEFINCMCAISKEEYPEICDDILNGKLNQVSMSCLAGICECSRCGNVATKEEELCEHMNPKHPNFCKGQNDENGKPIYEINRNIVFTGLSGVAVPADKDAFIFDVKASKKSKESIDKEYNKYLRAKKEYEYINSLLEKEDICKYIRKYIESKLEKKANKYRIEYKDGNFPKIHSIEAQSEEEAIEKYHKMYNNNEDVIAKNCEEIEASLKKKADIEYMSDTIKEIPPIDFETEFMLAGKSKGVNTDINKDQLEIGTKVEMEHTTNHLIAEKIAMDHIKEIPNYYTLLAEMEAKAKFEFEQAKDIINKETNKEFSTKLGSKQFFKVRKANLTKKATDYLNLSELRKYIKKVINQNKGIPCTDLEFLRKVTKGYEKPIKEIMAYRRKGPFRHDDYTFFEYSKGAKLIIELDGDYHQTGQYWYFDKQEEKKEQFNKQSFQQFFKVRKANNSKFRIGDHVKINYKLGDWELNNVLGKVLDVRTNNDGDNYYIVKIMGTNTTHTFHDQDLTLTWRRKMSSKNWFKIAKNIDNYGLSEIQKKELQNVIDHIDIVNENNVVDWDELVESVNQNILDYNFMYKNQNNIIDYIENELGQKIEVY